MPGRRESREFRVEPNEAPELPRAHPAAFLP